jgi:hypothetical protein
VHPRPGGEALMGLIELLIVVILILVLVGLVR